MMKEDLQQKRLKYEIAEELGLLPKRLEKGWAGLTAKESGMVGGLMSKRNGKK